MRVVRKIDIALAKTNKSRPLAVDGLSDSAVIDVVNEFSAPTMHLTMSMGHEDGTLSLANVRRLATKLLGANTVDVRQLRVSGATDDGEPIELIDLIEDRLEAHATLELDRHRRLTYAKRRDALREAYQDNLGGLNRMYGG